MIGDFAPLRSRATALIAQIMVSPWADSYLLLGSSLGALVLRFLIVGASYMADSELLKLSSCPAKHAPEANRARQPGPLRSP